MSQQLSRPRPGASPTSGWPATAGRSAAAGAAALLLALLTSLTPAPAPAVELSPEQVLPETGSDLVASCGGGVCLLMVSNGGARTLVRLAPEGEVLSRQPLALGRDLLLWTGELFVTIDYLGGGVPGAVRIQPDGTVLDAEPLPFFEPYGLYGQDRPADCREGLRMAWLPPYLMGVCSCQGSLWVGRLDLQTGERVDLPPRIHAGLGQSSLAALLPAPGSGEVLVVGGFTGEVLTARYHGLRLAEDGTLLDDAFLPLGHHSAWTGIVSGAFDGQGAWLFAWDSIPDAYDLLAPSSLYYVRVPVGAPPAPSAAEDGVLTRAWLSQSYPVLLHDGARLFAVWQDAQGSVPDDPMDPVRYDLYGSWLAPDGAPLDPLGFRISESRHVGVPAAAAAAPGRVLVAYSLTDLTTGTLLGTGVRLVSFAPLPAGSPCTTPSDCATTFCVDGVCCDQACGGGSLLDCQACSVAAGATQDGVCGARGAGAVCRPAQRTCDLPETCPGGTTACPPDEGEPDGTPCQDPDVCGGQGVCDRRVCWEPPGGCPTDLGKPAGKPAAAAVPGAGGPETQAGRAASALLPALPDEEDAAPVAGCALGRGPGSGPGAAGSGGVLLFIALIFHALSRRAAYRWAQVLAAALLAVGLLPAGCSEDLAAPFPAPAAGAAVHSLPADGTVATDRAALSPLPTEWCSPGPRESCPAGTSCLALPPRVGGGICTASCHFDADCADGGRCTTLQDGQRVCLSRCSRSLDCTAPGFVCLAAAGGQTDADWVCWYWDAAAGEVQAMPKPVLRKLDVPSRVRPNGLGIVRIRLGNDGSAQLTGRALLRSDTPLLQVQENQVDLDLPPEVDLNIQPPPPPSFKDFGTQVIYPGDSPPLETLPMTLLVADAATGRQWVFPIDLRSLVSGAELALRAPRLLRLPDCTILALDAENYGFGAALLTRVDVTSLTATAAVRSLYSAGVLTLEGILETLLPSAARVHNGCVLLDPAHPPGEPVEVLVTMREWTGVVWRERVDLGAPETWPVEELR